MNALIKNDFTTKKIAVFSAKGLGDGLISLVLSNNLQTNGADVTTFNDPLCELKQWFPNQRFLSTPSEKDLLAFLEKFDLVFAIDHSVATSVNLPNLIVIREKTLSKNLTWAENLLNICQNDLKLDKTTLYNGLKPPADKSFRKNIKRIAFHPTSTEEKRDWLPLKSLMLLEKLHLRGFEPVLCTGLKDREFWVKQLPSHILCPEFKSLDETASFLYECGYFIGVNSGLGHLASSLGLPTLSLFARMSYANLWRPSGPCNHVVTPYPVLIGSKLKHRFWKHCLTVNRVLRHFEKHYSEFN